MFTLIEVSKGGKIPVAPQFYPKLLAYMSIQRNDGLGCGELAITRNGEIRYTPYEHDRSFSGYYIIN